MANNPDSKAPERIWAECPRVGYGAWYPEHRGNGSFDAVEYIRADSFSAQQAAKVLLDWLMEDPDEGFADTEAWHLVTRLDVGALKALSGIKE